MASFSQRQLGNILGFFILLALGLFSESCGNTQQQSKNLVTSVDTLPDSMASRAIALIDNFRSSNGDISSDFFTDGRKSLQNKAIYFRLNPNQARAFFEELSRQKASAASGDSIRIGVQMGLFGAAGTRRPTRPNLTLLLDILKNSQAPAPEDYAFPLRPFKKLGDQIITNGKADTLTQNWKNISVNDITKQLYLNSDSSNPENRIKYYTFNAKDTENIYRYAQRNNNCSLYIYLGQLIQNDHVPLRVIIRLTPNQYTVPIDDEGEEDFEFAAPCPNHCI
ncbi:hypothetical protein [Haliscomenobacter sp.]|uniref:hypothetical protein n=1 Tax=Haliscomenobacter sp. TaxID=2717303 RepID=UPI0035941567